MILLNFLNIVIQENYWSDKMKVSELIRKLLEVNINHGDLEIRVGFEGINCDLEEFGIEVITWGKKKVLWFGD